MLKFSKANSKLKALQQVPSIQQFLQNKRKVYSYDSGLSGWTCPGAKDCLAKVYIENGRKKLHDGPDTQFRCFSASQEALLPPVYAQRHANFEYLQSLVDMPKGILESIPKNAGIIRINVAGDIFSQKYFDAIITVCNSRPDILFYTYTKSLPFWVRRLDSMPENLVMTASYGGKYDSLIKEYNLRSVSVVFDENTTLPIDHTDELAANPNLRHQDFALLLHGMQPAQSAAMAAIQKMKKDGTKFSYSS